MIVPRRSTAVWWLVAGLIAIRLLAIGVLLSSGVEDENSILGGDARRYEDINDAWGTPYEDFEVEYPPGSVLLIDAVQGDDTLDTLTRLSVSQLLLELATAGVLWWAFSRRTAVVYLVLGTPMAFFPFPYVRIDLLSVFLAVLGVGLLRRKHDLPAGVALAAAVFAKLWPLALMPIVLVERRGRALLACVISGAVGLVVWFGLTGVSGPNQVLSFRGSKGWQIESFPGVLFHLFDPEASRVENGAWRTAVEVPGWARLLLLACGLAVVVVSWWLAAQARRHEPDDDVGVFALAPLAAVLGLLIFSPIISPQYVLWILPFVAVAAARGHASLGWLGLAVSALSTFVLATIHAQIDGKLYALAPIMVRNVLLVVMLAMTLRALASYRSTPVGKPPTANLSA